MWTSFSGNLFMMKVALLFLVALFAFSHASLSETNVKLTLGKIAGEKLVSSSGKDLFVFLGIPYAKPPIEELRFERPEPVQKWDDVLDATKEGPFCPQVNFLDGQITGVEDCLFLNVYTPKLPSDNENEKFPVMVFFHGGGFAFGTSNPSLYNPRRIVDKNVVVVTVNYRLGVLGFLSTNDEVSPGNYGLFDQTLALKWMKDHISAFGGDPNRVTIFGQSAGAGSVGYHLLSPHSKGLFHGAILQSGSPLCPWGLQEYPKVWAKRVAIKLECSAHNSKLILDCLRNKTAFEIIEAQSKLEFVRFLPMVFVPVVEKTADGFVTEDPATLFSKGKFNKVPVIIGKTNAEGASCFAALSRTFDQVSDEFWDEDLPEILPVMGDILENSKIIAKAARLEFLDNKDETDKFGNARAVVRVYSDLLFDVGLDLTSKYFAKSGIPTFTYLLNYKGKFSYTDALGMQQNLGVSHADDLHYFFDSVIFPIVSGEDLDVAETLVTLWTNFAYEKNPTPESSSLTFKWEQNDYKNPNYLQISNYIPTMQQGRFSDKVKFWTEDIYKLSSKKIDQAFLPRTPIILSAVINAVDTGITMTVFNSVIQHCISRS